ncbi:hypothetical protein QYM36_004314 [Artemia franciscana]|uniref:Uncharacterized protein n=1 Tax=Artemia franciscana TaxID=6661 RepID=A0AA88I9F1_ARTSF|nr:hypothetical protein QYM36_004314 [Artemia franciscana]
MIILPRVLFLVRPIHKIKIPMHFLGFGRVEEGDILIEEEYDALNDETFGNGEDWDEDATKVDCFNANIDDKADMADEEMALEASVSQLVDEDDSDIATKTLPASIKRVCCFID